MVVTSIRAAWAIYSEFDSSLYYIVSLCVLNEQPHQNNRSYKVFVKDRAQGYTDGSNGRFKASLIAKSQFTQQDIGMARVISSEDNLCKVCVSDQHTGNIQACSTGTYYKVC